MNRARERTGWAGPPEARRGRASSGMGTRKAWGAFLENFALLQVKVPPSGPTEEGEREAR
jgi:hypothetical protein